MEGLTPFTLITTSSLLHSEMSTCVGVLGNSQVASFIQGWLHLSEEVERFAQFKSFSWTSGILLFSTYHRPKQSFHLSNSCLVIVQEPHIMQQRSSEKIIANPLLFLSLAFVQSLFQTPALTYLFGLHCFIWSKRWNSLGLQSDIRVLVSNILFLRERDPVCWYQVFYF